MKETDVQKSIRASFDRIYWLLRPTPEECLCLEFQLRLGTFFTEQVQGNLGVNLAIIRLGGSEEFYVPARNFFAGFPLARGET